MKDTATSLTLIHMTILAEITFGPFSGKIRATDTLTSVLVRHFLTIVKTSEYFLILMRITS